MKLLASRIFGMLLLFVPSLLFSFPASLPFFDGSWEELQKEAAQKQLPFFVYVFQEGAAACEKMASETFVYPELVEYAGCSYLPYQMEAQRASQEGIPGFSLTTLPSILVFGPGGQAWGKIEGFLSGPALLERLRALRHAHAAGLFPTETVPLQSRLKPIAVATQPRQSGEMSRGGTGKHSFLDPVSDKEIALAGPVVREVPTTLLIEEVQVSRYQGWLLSGQDLQVADSYKSPEHKISLWVRFDLQRHRQAEPFGVEVARFTSGQELEEEVKRFERLWKDDIWIHASETGGRKTYRLILGSYASEEEARAFALPMRKVAHVDAEVVDFRQLLRPNL